MFKKRNDPQRIVLLKYFQKQIMISSLVFCREISNFRMGLYVTYAHGSIMQTCEWHIADEIQNMKIFYSYLDLEEILDIKLQKSSGKL